MSRRPPRCWEAEVESPSLWFKRVANLCFNEQLSTPAERKLKRLNQKPIQPPTRYTRPFHWERSPRQ